MPTPTLVQHCSSCQSGFTTGGTGGSLAGSVYHLGLPNATLASNMLILAIQCQDANTSWTVADDQSNAGWVKAKDIHDTTNGSYLAVWYCPNATAGVTSITATPGANASNVSWCFSEFYNVATSSPSDATAAGAFSSGTTVSPGALSTATNGDLIWSTFVQDNRNPAPAALTAITQAANFTLLHADRIFGTAAQYWVQATSGSITASFTAAPSTGFIAIAIALKSAAAGTAPTAVPRIVHRYTTWIDSTTSQVLQFPCTGNMLAALWDGFGNNGVATTVSIADSHTNTWTSRNTTSTSTNPFVTCQGLDTDAATTTTGATTTLTLTVNQTTFECIFEVLDIVAPLASGNYDTAAGTSGNQTTTGNLTGVTITPTTANGLVLTQIVWWYGSAQALASPPAGTFLDFGWFPEDTGSPTDSFEENNGRAHTYNTSTSAITYTWSKVDDPGFTGAHWWSNVALAYKGSGPPANIDQYAYRWRNDDGSESAATWAATANTDITDPTGQAQRLRVGMNSIATAGATTYQLEVKKSTDSTYQSVTTSNAQVVTTIDGASGSDTSSTWTCPPWVTAIQVECWGPGGAGSRTTTASRGGGGGGGGGYSIRTAAAVTPGTAYTYTIGGGGTDASGTVFNGADTTITLDSAVVCMARHGVTAAANSVTHGAGAANGTGDTVHAGGSGADGVASTYSGGSGGSGGGGSDGGAGSTSSGGGAGTAGSYTAGAAGVAGKLVAGGTQNGTDGNAPGAGGSGGYRAASGTGGAGRGAAGRIKITYTPAAPFLLSASANISAGGTTATTAQLGSPGGGASFSAGEISDDTNPLPSLTIATGSYTELEWCVVATANATNAATYQFRVTAGGTAF